MTLREIEAAAVWLYEDDPEWVIGGCADVSGILFDYAAERGITGVRVVHGTASRMRKGGGFPHVWLTIDGARFDPVAHAQGVKLARYREGEGGRLAVAGSYLDDSCTVREDNGFRLRALMRALHPPRPNTLP